MLDVSSDDLFSLVATANRRINKNIMGQTCQNSGNGNRRHPKLARKPKQLPKPIPQIKCYFFILLYRHI